MEFVCLQKIKAFKPRVGGCVGWILNMGRESTIFLKWIKNLIKILQKYVSIRRENDGKNGFR